MKEIKLFKRFLKELGIYSLYICERNSFLDMINESRNCKGQTPLNKKAHFWIETLAEFIKTNNVGGVIDASFGWTYTKNSKLWKDLYVITNFQSIYWCLENTDYIKQLLNPYFIKNESDKNV